MKLDEILQAFSQPEGLPVEAIEAARTKRKTVTPRFLKILTASAESDDETCADDEPLFFIIHLLAEFGETRAFAPLTQFLVKDSDRVDAVLGDSATETLEQVLLSLFDGDVEAVHRVIEAPEADPFVRCSMFEVLAALALMGEIDRGDVERYLTDCYDKLRPQSENFAWYGWAQAIALLGLTDGHALVRKAYRKGFIDQDSVRWNEIEQDLREGAACEDPEELLEARGYEPFADCLEAFSSWEFETSSGDAEDDDEEAGESHVNPYRDVGRNDPCPCGSGKKFKKCCLQVAAA